MSSGIKFDGKSGDIHDREVFYHVEEENAVPDGDCMDVEGCLWIAGYGVGKIVRVSPEGKQIGEIFLLTRLISGPAFAGSELFITSAAEAHPDEFPECATLAGQSV